jgi:hypothetical protein
MCFHFTMTWCKNARTCRFPRCRLAIEAKCHLSQPGSWRADLLERPNLSAGEHWQYLKGLTSRTPRRLYDGTSICSGVSMLLGSNLRAYDTTSARIGVACGVANYAELLVLLINGEHDSVGALDYIGLDLDYGSQQATFWM